MLLDERVRAELAGRRPASPTSSSLDVTDSTNRVSAGRAAAGAAPEGLVVAADLQTAGRGRLDRTWEAAPGAALLVSVLLRPADLPAVPLAPGHGRGRPGRPGRLRARSPGSRPDLKWPNDLLVGDRKLAGILAEVAGGRGRGGHGANVHDAPAGAAWAGRRRPAGGSTGRDLLAAWLARPRPPARATGTRWRPPTGPQLRHRRPAGGRRAARAGSCRRGPSGIDDDGSAGGPGRRRGRGRPCRPAT